MHEAIIALNNVNNLNEMNVFIFACKRRFCYLNYFECLPQTFTHRHLFSALIHCVYHGAQRKNDASPKWLYAFIISIAIIWRKKMVIQSISFSWMSYSKTSFHIFFTVHHVNLENKLSWQLIASGSQHSIDHWIMRMWCHSKNREKKKEERKTVNSIR